MVANSMAPGCGCCATTPPAACDVTISGYLVPLSSGGFCPAPQAIRYTITGTTTDGRSVSIGGTINQYSGNNYAFSFVIGGTALPDGTYSGHFYEYGTNPCQPIPGPTGRFDVTVGIRAGCPKQTNTVVLPAQFDFVTGGGSFGLVYCDPQPYVPGDTNPTSWGRTTCLGDTLTPALSITASGSATACSQTVDTTQGYISATFKVTGYPVTISAGCTAPNCDGDSVTTTWTACNTGFATTGDRTAGVYYLKIPIYAFAINDQPTGGPNKAVAGASVQVSGFYNGSGITNAVQPGTGGAGVCGLKHITVTIDRTRQSDDYAWTVSATGYRSATYTKTTTDNDQGKYQGLYCPLGGYLEKSS